MAARGEAGMGIFEGVKSAFNPLEPDAGVGLAISTTGTVGPLGEGVSGAWNVDPLAGLEISTVEEEWEGMMGSRILGGAAGVDLALAVI